MGLLSMQGGTYYGDSVPVAVIDTVLSRLQEGDNIQYKGNNWVVASCHVKGERVTIITTDTSTTSTPKRLIGKVYDAVKVFVR